MLKNVKKINVMHVACDSEMGGKRHISTLELFLIGKPRQLFFAWLPLFHLAASSSLVLLQRL